jgi:hypothetical protein
MTKLAICRFDATFALPDGDVIAHAVLVIDLLSYAYDVPSNPSPRLNSLPDWTYGDRYGKEAKASPYAFTTTMDAEAQLKVKQMIRPHATDVRRGTRIRQAWRGHDHQHQLRRWHLARNTQRCVRRHQSLCPRLSSFAAARTRRQGDPRPSGAARSDGD